MDLAGIITTYIISGIIGFTSLFNPAVAVKPTPKPTTPTIIPMEETVPEQAPTISKNKQKRKLNIATIPKTEQIQVGVPLLPLKEFLDPKTVIQVQKTKEVTRPQQKDVFDIINTIPTLITKNTEPSIDPITRIQNSIGNIFCKTQSGNSISVVTGSAVIVNSLGVAITNAHVAQYPLIEKYFKSNSGKTMSCVGRIGSPASGNYKIDVLYISPNWIRKNAKNIVDPYFQETGEDDIAIIRFVPTTSKTFTFTKISNEGLNISLPIYIGSYPAIEIKDKGISAPLYGRYERNSIRQIDNYIPLKPIFETEPSSMGQAGSSGGGIFDSVGNLAGTIALIVQNGNTSSPYIRGLTISHINKTLGESGTSLNHYITGNPDVIENNFSKTATELESILMSQLSSSR